MICGRTESRLQETQLQLRKEGSRVESYVCDVTDRRSVESLCEAVGATFKKIDILVNNAGLGGPNPIDEGNEQLWDSILEANLKGPFLFSSEVLKWMPEGGRIVNLSSVLGKFGVPGYTAYCSSKHGIVGFTRALALELPARRRKYCNQKKLARWFASLFRRQEKTLRVRPITFAAARLCTDFVEDHLSNGSGDGGTVQAEFLK